MTRQLTDSERHFMIEAHYVANVKSTAKADNFEAGFVAGLSHNQAKLDKLIAFIKGEILYAEIEEIVK